jgi:hypothetical protein
LDHVAAIGWIGEIAHGQVAGQLIGGDSGGHDGLLTRAGG